MNEYQAAYENSRSSLPPDDKGRIRALIAAGRHVVVSWGIPYCPVTDASLPVQEHWVADYATRAEAEAKLAEFEGQQYDDSGYYIAPLGKPIGQSGHDRPAVDHGDIPF